MIRCIISYNKTTGKERVIFTEDTTKETPTEDLLALGFKVTSEGEIDKLPNSFPMDKDLQWIATF